MSRPPVRTSEALQTAFQRRLTIVERRLASRSAPLPGRLDADLVPLGSGVDLDDITLTGWYVQTTNADATLVLNYPAARAGHLEVSASTSGTDAILQTYTDYQNLSVWRRTYSGGVWSSWLRSDPAGILFRVSASSTQTATANVYLHLTTCWGTPEVNRGFTSWASGVLTVERTGWYQIHFQVGFQTGGSPDRMQARVNRNDAAGPPDNTSPLIANGYGINGMQGSTAYLLTAGDALRPWVNSIGVTRTVDNNPVTSLEVRYLGAP